MSKVTIEHQKPGDYYDETKTTSVQADLTAILVTNDLTSDNLGAEAIDTYNLDHAANDYGFVAEYSAQSGSQQTYSVSSGSSINHGTGGRITFSPAITVNVGDVVRLHGNVVVGECTIDGTGTSDRDDEYFFWFRWKDTTGPTWYDVSPQWGYATQQRNGGVGANEGSDTEISTPFPGDYMQWQRCGFDWVFIVDTARTIDEIQMRVRVANSLNTVDIHQYSLTAIIQRS